MLFAVLAVSVSRRSTAPGTDLDLLVLASMREGCVAVDLASGAFVRAAYPAAGRAPLRPVSVARARILGGDEEPDPAHPESVALVDVPLLTGHGSARRAER